MGNQNRYTVRFSGAKDETVYASRVFETRGDAESVLIRQLGVPDQWFPFGSYDDPTCVSYIWHGDNATNTHHVSRLDEGWVIDELPTKGPLYGEVHLSDPMFAIVVQNCADASALQCRNCPGTTSVGGWLAIHRSDWTTLKHKVVLVLTHDTFDGGAYAALATQELRDIARYLRLERFPAKYGESPTSNFLNRLAGASGDTIRDVLLKSMKTDGDYFEEAESRVSDRAQ